MAAARWHARAGAFFGKSDFAAAARHCQQARELLRRVADDPRAPALGANVCFHALTLGIRLGPSESEAKEIFEEGLDWAARAGDARAAGRLHQALSVLEIANHRIDAALRHAAEWERVACTLADEDLRACAIWPTLQPLQLRGDLAGLRANCLQQLTWTHDHPEWGMRDWNMSAQAGALWQLGYAETFDGSFGRARGLLERAVDVAARVGDAEMGVAARTAIADLGFLAGEPEMARAVLEQCVRMSEPLGAMSRLSSHGRLGRQLLLDDRAAEAVEALEYALSLCGDVKRVDETFLRHALAQAWLAAGDPARARAIAEDSLRHCLAIGFRLVAIEGAVTLSAALRVEAGLPAAPYLAELLATADRLIAETGACNLTAFVMIERAALAELRGMIDEQGAHLRRAHAAFTEMGATGRARTVGAALDRLATGSSSG